MSLLGDLFSRELQDVFFKIVYLHRDLHHS